MDGHKQRLSLLQKSFNQPKKEMRSAITSHVLDTALGRPAEGVPIQLEFKDGIDWIFIGREITNSDGRALGLCLNSQSLQVGVYRITFDTATYFNSISCTAFYPEVSVVFSVQDAAQHFHIPLLLNPYGYSTYRGS